MLERAGVIWMSRAFLVPWTFQTWLGFYKAGEKFLQEFSFIIKSQSPIRTYSNLFKHAILLHPWPSGHYYWLRLCHRHSWSPHSWSRHSWSRRDDRPNLKPTSTLFPRGQHCQACSCKLLFLHRRWLSRSLLPRPECSRHLWYVLCPGWVTILC